LSRGRFAAGRKSCEFWDYGITMYAWEPEGKVSVLSRLRKGEKRGAVWRGAL